MQTTATMATEVPPARPGLRRRPEQGVIGGVCAGVAERFGVEPFAVRVAFGLMTFFGGLGVALYVVAWVLVPAVPDPSGGRTRRPFARGGAVLELLGAGLMTLVAITLLHAEGRWVGAPVWPLFLGAIGLGLVARQAGGGRLPVGSGRIGGVFVAVLGPLLIAAAALALLRALGVFDGAGRAIAGVAVILTAAGLVFGPWAVRLVRSLGDERAHRIREQARADMAAHLHDSVLQTLALIQKRSDDPGTVSALARRQERELRRWLFDGHSGDAADSLGGALRAAAEEVEGLHGVPIEVVTVGDAPMGPRIEALVQAAREAMSNAARFSEADQVDLFAEAAPGRIDVFVRDRGIGFDPQQIPEDRRGVRHSIVERMDRHGGTATITSEPGAGTEIELVMER
jgi:phage shock protein PspC (stress-responsive transcriptional regulator)